MDQNINEQSEDQVPVEPEGHKKQTTFAPDKSNETDTSSRAKLAESISVKSHESVGSYNPFEERNVLKPTSNVGALAHMLKTSLGTGILAMPMAFKNAGLLLGAFGTVFLGIVCTHCIELLVINSHALCKRCKIPLLTYPETMEKAFETGPKPLRKLSRALSLLVTTMLLTSFILGNTIYVVFISETIQQVVEHHFQKGINIRLYILMLWVPLILICMFENLKSLVPFSIIANILVIVSFAITTYYIFRDVNSTDTVDYVAAPQYWPFFLATVIFAIEGIGTILPIENEMQHPESFVGKKYKCGVVHIGMTIVVLLYGLIGFFGYLEYGDKVKGSITLNLPLEEILAQIVKILIALAIFFTYALQFYVPINIVTTIIKSRIPQKWHVWAFIGVRVGLVTLTIIMSITIPNLEPIISLVGSVCFSVLGLLFPAVVDTVVRWGNLGVWQWRLYKNVLIALLSIIALISGTYVSLDGIIKSYE